MPSFNRNGMTNGVGSVRASFAMLTLCLATLSGCIAPAGVAPDAEEGSAAEQSSSLSAAELGAPTDRRGIASVTLLGVVSSTRSLHGGREPSPVPWAEHGADSEAEARGREPSPVPWSVRGEGEEESASNGRDRAAVDPNGAPQ